MATHGKPTEGAFVRTTRMQALWIVLALLFLVGGVIAMFMAYD